MSQSPQQESASKTYQDAWRAVNLLIRSDGSWSGRERDICYINEGDGAFTDAAFVSGMDLNADGRAFAPMDLDGDGDLDLILKNRSGVQLRAFRNDFQAAPRMIMVRAAGRQSNRDGVGALLTLETDRRKLVRAIASGSGFLSQRPRVAEFGLLDGEEPLRLNVAWPGGSSSTFESLPVDDRRWLAIEGEAELQSSTPQPARKSTGEAVAAPAGPGVRLSEAVPAPEFELESLDGTAVSLGESKGRKALVNFWATWCPPCRKEMADFVQYAARLEQAGIRVLAVSVDEPAERPAVESFAKEFGVEIPVLLADDATVSAYTVLQHNLFDRRTDLAIPTSFLVDESGDVTMVYRGETDAATILRDLEGGTALPFAGRWVRSGPNRDFVALGASYAERGLTEPALAAFERAWETGVHSPELSNNFAGALVQAGALDRAEELLRNARAANPNDLDAAVNLASVLLAKGDGAGAYDLARMVVDARSDDGAALVLMGSAAFLLGQRDEAERHYRRAIEIDPTRPEPHENLGGLLASAGRFEPAIAMYEEAIRLGAGSSKLYSNLGSHFMLTGSPARGLLAFRQAAELAPGDYGANLNLALYYSRSGNAGMAREWAGKAREADPSRPEAYFLGAEAASILGDRAGARALLEELLRRQPTSTAAREALNGLE